MKVSKDLREHIEAQVRAKAAPAREELDALIQAEEAKAREFHDRLDAMAEPVRRRIAEEVEKAFGRGEFRMKWSQSSPTNIRLPSVNGRGDYETKDLGRLHRRRSDLGERTSSRVREIVVALELGGTADDLERMLSETSFAKFRPGIPGRPVHPRRKGGAE